VTAENHETPGATAPAPSIRPLTHDDELEQCVRLQREVWGDDFRELVPPAVLLVAQKVGGVALGAFGPAGELLGFVFGITGLRDGRPAHWSHMLAVRSDLRDRGVGRRLKEAQRTHLRALGVGMVYWTFDPLVSRNAHLNVHRLGASVIEYVRDMYGRESTSPTTTVIGTDRFLVGWDIREARSTPRVAWGASIPALTLGLDAAVELPDVPELLIEIPLDIQEVKARDPDRARAWRRMTRAAFEHYLGRGYHVADFLRGAQGKRGRYLLRREAAPR